MTTLRKVLIGVSLGVLALDVAMVLGGLPTGAVAATACWALILLVSLLIERAQYKAILEAPPGPGWRANGERFVDPESGRDVAVYEEAGSGRRAYVADGG
jgi:hypothetical protein